MRDRSVIEIMVLTFTFVIAFAIVGLGLLIVVIEWKSPESDTALLATTLSSLVSGILGALLGLIAGRATPSGTEEALHHRPDGSEDTVG